MLGLDNLKIDSAFSNIRPKARDSRRFKVAEEIYRHIISNLHSSAMPEFSYDLPIKVTDAEIIRKLVEGSEINFYDANNNHLGTAIIDIGINRDRVLRWIPAEEENPERIKEESELKFSISYSIRRTNSTKETIAESELERRIKEVRQEKIERGELKLSELGLGYRNPLRVAI